MHKKTFILALLLFMLGVQAQTSKEPSAPQPEAKEIKQLADFELFIFDSKKELISTKLSTITKDNNVTVIYFWATWASPCVKAIPDFVAAKKVYRAKGVEIYGLSIEGATESNRRDPNIKNKEAVLAIIKKLKINHQIGFSPLEMFEAFDNGNGAIPYTLIFGKDGKLVKHYRGFNPTIAPKMLRDTIDKALES